MDEEMLCYENVWMYAALNLKMCQAKIPATRALIF